MFPPGPLSPQATVSALTSGHSEILGSASAGFLAKVLRLPEISRFANLRLLAASDKAIQAGNGAPRG